MKITLPLPHKLLSPNARPHWRAKATQTKQHRLFARLACAGADLRELDAATVRVHWYFKDKRRRDVANFDASLKAYWDGIVDAGVLKDDDKLTHLPSVIDYDKFNPRVEIELTP